jgi:hypothetical protein
MVRNTKKKALYEVILGAGQKSGYDQLHPKGVGHEPAEQITPTAPVNNVQGQAGVEVKQPTNTGPSVMRWARKPRVVQFNAGRVEFSVPYQLGIAILLGAVLIIVVAFRLGERFGRSEAGGQSTVKQPLRLEPAKQVGSVSQPAQSQGQPGKNRIVIQTYQVRTHLEPAKEYFDKLGVTTEILQKDNWYYLVTKNRYDNIDKPGTNGYMARQKIVELGAGYKAPPGYEAFGPKPFSTAFGMKFDE